VFPYQKLIQNGVFDDSTPKFGPYQAILKKTCNFRENVNVYIIGVIIYEDEFDS